MSKEAFAYENLQGEEHEEEQGLPPQYTTQAPEGHQVPQPQPYPIQPVQPYVQQPGYNQYYVDPNSQVVVPAVVPAVIPPPVQGVKDYFLHNILVLVFCCLPIGIVGIIKSSECKSAIAVGDVARAQRLSAEAKKMATIGCICGSVLIGLIVVFYVVLLALI